MAGLTNGRLTGELKEGSPTYHLSLAEDKDRGRVYNALMEWGRTEEDLYKVQVAAMARRSEAWNAEIKKAEKFSQTYGKAIDALTFVAKKNKEFAVPAKTVLIAQSIAVTYANALKQLGQPWPMNMIAMAFTVAGGLMAVEKIRQQKFEYGGPVVGPLHAAGGVSAELEGGENVWSREDVKAMGGQSEVETLKQRARGGSGYSVRGSATFSSLRRFATEQERVPFLRAQGAN